MGAVSLDDIDKFGPEAAAQIRRQMGLPVVVSDTPAKASRAASPKAAPTDAPRRKYRNEPVEVDGWIFPSMREARRYRLLKAMQLAGSISGLEIQPAFDFKIDGDTIFVYVADFRYTWIESGEKRIEDAKGVRTDVYRLKKKLIEKQHRVTILEV